MNEKIFETSITVRDMTDLAHRLPMVLAASARKGVMIDRLDMSREPDGWLLLFSGRKVQP